MRKVGDGSNTPDTIPSLSGGGRHFCFGGLAAKSADKFYATLCRVLRKRSRCTLDNVQHAQVTSLKARGRDTILV